MSENSLAEWMIENLGENSIDKYWSNKNEISPCNLSKYSHKKAWIKCQETDYHEDYEVMVKNFTLKNSRCLYCRGLKVHPKDSFAQWIIDTYGKDFLDQYWSDKNTLSPWEITIGSKKKVFIKCQNVNYHDVFETKPYEFVSNGKRCPYCSGRKVHPNDSFAQWCVDNIDKNFIRKYWSDKNKENPYEIAKYSNKEIYIKCQKANYHDDYKTASSRFIYQGQRCPCCSNRHGKVHKYDSLGSIHTEVISLWSSENKLSPFEYAPKSNQIVFWKCGNGLHDDYKRSIYSSNDANFRCPSCVQERDESILQEKVRIFLTNEMNLKVYHEHNCSLQCINPKTNFRLPYDNEVLINDNRLIVEVHGEHHYKESGYNTLSAKSKRTTPLGELKYIQWKDTFKKEFALSQEYYYLAIPYWTDNVQEEWKDLIFNKLKEIIKY